MCVVSMTAGFFEEKYKPLVPYINTGNRDFYKQNVTPEEFDKLRKEVEDMKELLKRSKEYDTLNNLKNCQVDSKIDFLNDVSQLVGVTLNDVFLTTNLTSTSNGF